MGEVIETIGCILIVLAGLVGLIAYDYWLWSLGAWCIAVVITLSIIGGLLTAIGRNWDD